MAKATSTKKIANIREGSRIDMPLLIVVLMLLALGIVMVLSASAPSALADYGNSYRYVMTQGVAAVGGLIAMHILSKTNYHWFKKYYKIIYWLSVGILLLVLIPGLGVESNGAKRWINLKVIQLQPSELTKIGLIIYYAGYFTDESNNLKGIWRSCLRPIVALAIPIGILYVVQNHMSAGIVMAFITLVIIVMSGCEFKYLASLFSIGIGGIGLIAILFKDKITSGFRSDRIEAWLHPFENYNDKAYQTIQGLYAIGSGGLFGVGLGESKQKYLYIPEAHNDFIFAILAEELGFVGCMSVLLLFAVFTVRGVLISIRASDMFGSLIAIGITTLISTQAILNVAVVTNSMPNTGISLPFLSYGGSSLMILLSCVGILLNISRSAKKI